VLPIFKMLNKLISQMIKQKRENFSDDFTDLTESTDTKNGEQELIQPASTSIPVLNNTEMS